MRHYRYHYLLPSTTTHQRQDIVYHLTKQDNGRALGGGGAGAAGEPGQGAKAGDALGRSVTLPTSGRGRQLQPVSSEPSCPWPATLQTHAQPRRPAGAGARAAARRPHFTYKQPRLRKSRTHRPPRVPFSCGEFHPFRWRKRLGNHGPACSSHAGGTGRGPGRGRVEPQVTPRTACPASSHEAPSGSSGPGGPAISSGPSALLQKKATSFAARLSMALTPPS